MNHTNAGLGVPVKTPEPADLTQVVPSYNPGEVEDLRRSVKLIHDWIHSGDRASDPEVQAGQWGVNVCEWLTRYCTRLRADNARLTAACMTAPKCKACGGVYAFRGSRDGKAEVYSCETPGCADSGVEFELCEYHDEGGASLT